MQASTSTPTGMCFVSVQQRCHLGSPEVSAAIKEENLEADVGEGGEEFERQCETTIKARCA